MISSIISSVSILFLALVIVNIICEIQVPEDIKLYYAEEYSTPFIGGILVYIKWTQIL